MPELMWNKHEVNKYGKRKVILEKQKWKILRVEKEGSVYTILVQSKGDMSEGFQVGKDCNRQMEGRMLHSHWMQLALERGSCYWILDFQGPIGYFVVAAQMSHSLLYLNLFSCSESFRQTKSSFYLYCHWDLQWRANGTTSLLGSVGHHLCTTLWGKSVKPLVTLRLGTESLPSHKQHHTVG